MHAISEGLVDHADVFDTVLNLLERSKPDATATWNGRLHGLEEDQLSNAIFYLLLERWLPLFEWVDPKSYCLSLIAEVCL